MTVAADSVEEDGRSGWLPTPNVVRAVSVALVTMSVGVLGRRADLVILVLPLAVVAAWSMATRPRHAPSVRTTLGPTALPEGSALTFTAFVSVPAGAPDVAIVLASDPFFDPVDGTWTLCADAGPDAGSVTLAAPIAARRWGRYRTGAAVPAVTGIFGGFRHSFRPIGETEVVVLPGKESFASRTGMPHPRGIVGANRSPRRGQGNDFAAIRPYGPGDRLARVNWAVSTRTATLQVSEMHADLDTAVTLVVDAFHDLGSTGGVGGAASSLDTAVRATTALAEHYLRAGERVGLLVLGASDVPPLTARSGQAQLRRIQDGLARIVPGTVRGGEDDATGALLARLQPGGVVLLLTPVISASALNRAYALARFGHTVLIIDTLPPAALTAGRLTAEDLAAIAPFTNPRAIPTTRLAWRIRLLEREGQLQRVRASGIPVVPWRGPGSLDEVLRQLQRRARAPRVARR
ncbi:DUF58 domain-containing protein [Nostocoides jenkinsii]|uniref:DUF58 domain-containing protein n=1 Tax=Nostocoides jenkinsii Ben 74 TaxID=1193518 RepID=A0A077MCN6_9MICO|nr:DUF58 domain-containing protein [Tetrasphaera jenkinsii]CCI54354.1 conserved hypothetical protein [Tetrasphaera jenkinsii Ben 74]